jgi:hypothetical protein
VRKHKRLDASAVAVLFAESVQISHIERTKRTLVGVAPKFGGLAWRIGNVAEWMVCISFSTVSRLDYRVNRCLRRCRNRQQPYDATRYY